MAERAPATYHVDQQVACPRGDHLLVGTVLRTHWTGRIWQYQVRFGDAWEEWIVESAISGVQATLFELPPAERPAGVGDCQRDTP